MSLPPAVPEFDAPLLHRAPVEVTRRYSGAASTELDLLRPMPGGPRIFVQATLPDGSLGVFLVDTGADVSVLSDKAAERLGLRSDREVDVWGLSGSASVRAVLLPTLQLGDVVVHDTDVLIGVPGFTDQIAFMPVDGLIGNNVWSQFTLEIDYPADKMVLSPPGEGPPRRKSAPMFFDGSHIHTLVTVTTTGDDPRDVQVITQVDTGASELTLCAATGLPFTGAYTQGLETVRGIGASETLPPFRFLEMTRRIPVDHVELGGTRVNVGIPARWVAYENTRTATCGTGGMKALLGHEYLSGNRVVFDYAEGRLALTKSKRRPRQIDGHAVLLGQEVGRYGEPPERALIRGKLLLGMGEDDRAIAALNTFVATDGIDPAEHAEAQVLLARVLQVHGRHEEAWRVLGSLSAGDLVDQDQIVATVNGLVFDGRLDEAVALAERGVAERPDAGWAHVALSDVSFQRREYDRAQDELLRAADLEQYPDAHLLRRARVALATGDRYGAMARVRKLLELYPGGGMYLWFYAMLVEDDGDRTTFRSDVDAAMARLHPFDQPSDFLVGANRTLGDLEAVRTGLAAGLRDQCDPLPAETPDHDNCVAWFEALAGVEPDDALTRIDRALAATGERSDFLDTKAMVHLSRDEYAAALSAAHAAARLAPDDIYMLWQAERIAQLAEQQLGVAPIPRGAIAADAAPAPVPATARSVDPPPAQVTPGADRTPDPDPDPRRSSRTESPRRRGE
ncbi:MAG: retroviral-like aspartic protease family protein [Myxococcota bacterium]